MSDTNTGGGVVYWGTDTVQQLSKLICSAEKHVYLVSPYVQPDGIKNLLREISTALQKRVQVSLVVRKKDSSTRLDVRDSVELRALVTQGLKLYEVPDLHAKVYFSDKAAILTSLNLLPSSINNSIEIGVRFDAGAAEYNRIDEFLRTRIKMDRVLVEESLRNPPAKLRSKTGRRSSKRHVELSPDEGFCIRCRDDLELDPEKPLCRDCYRAWQEYENERYREKYCHDCGEESSTSFARPLCKDCYELQAA